MTFCAYFVLFKQKILWNQFHILQRTLYFDILFFFTQKINIHKNNRSTYIYYYNEFTYVLKIKFQLFRFSLKNSLTRTISEKKT